MKLTAATLALSLTCSPVWASDPAEREALLDFIETNQLDANLYNLLAASIPATPAGQALYDACGTRLIEDMFENGYSHVRKTMGEVWRGALADIYTNHLNTDDLEQFAALEGNDRRNAIADTLTAEPVINDLRTGLAPLIEEAVARHVNHMLDEAEIRCQIEN